MAAPLVHVLFILDESGSMGCARGATIPAFNEFVETLKECKGAEIRFTLFRLGHNQLGDAISRKSLTAVPIQDVPELSHRTYNPRFGLEALYDATAVAIKEAEASPLAGKSKTVIAIQADGGDCGSVTYKDVRKLKSLVNAKQKEGWEFTFLASVHSKAVGPDNPDPYGGWAERTRGLSKEIRSVAETMGIESDHILEYLDQGSETETQKAFASNALNIGAFGSGRADNAAFGKESAS